MALSLWCGGCPFLLEVRPGPPFSGPSVFLMLVVGPSFLGLGFGLSLLEWWLALPSWGSGFGLSFSGKLLAPPSRARPSFSCWWLALPSWGSGWPCLLGVGIGPVPLGVRVGPAFLGFGFSPFLLEVRAGPPFSGPSVFLVLVLGPSFFAVGVWPFLVGVGLALPSWGSGWPCLFGVGLGPSFLR